MQHYNLTQDGPSLESSSYLNVTLRYLGPWDPWTLWPLDLGTPTLGLSDFGTSSQPQPPHTYSYLLLSLPTSFYLFLPPPTFSYMVWFGKVWFGIGGEGGLSFDIRDWDMRWTYDLYIDVRKFTGGWWWVHLDYSVSSGPFFEFWHLRLRLEMDQDPRDWDGPGPELDNMKFCSNQKIH